MQLLPEAPMQCCLALPGVACTNTSTDKVDIVSPYSRLIGTMNNDTRLQHLPRYASQPNYFNSKSPNIFVCGSKMLAQGLHCNLQST
jgi:hypothetical protein